MRLSYQKSGVEGRTLRSTIPKTKKSATPKCVLAVQRPRRRRGRRRRKRRGHRELYDNGHPMALDAIYWEEAFPGISPATVPTYPASFGFQHHVACDLYQCAPFMQYLTYTNPLPVTLSAPAVYYAYGHCWTNAYPMGGVGGDMAGGMLSQTGETHEFNQLFYK